MARSSSPDLSQSASIKALSVPTPPATAPYPDDLLEKYKALVRLGYLGILLPQQEHELAHLKQEIQAISRQDERAQSAARQVEEVIASLEALEAQVDVRIAQREAERKGAAKEPA